MRVRASYWTFFCFSVRVVLNLRKFSPLPCRCRKSFQENFLTTLLYLEGKKLCCVREEVERLMKMVGEIKSLMFLVGKKYVEVVGVD